MPRTNPFEADADAIPQPALPLYAHARPELAGTLAIARATGLTIATVLRYFGGHPALWRGLACWLTPRIELVWLRALDEGADPGDRLRRLARAHLTFVEAVRELPADSMAHEGEAGNAVLRSTLRGIVQRLQVLIASTVASGQLAGCFDAEIEPREASMMIVGTIQGTVLRWSLAGRSFDVVAEGERAVELVLRHVLGTPDPLARRPS